jgi:hypothetical protein
MTGDSATGNDAPSPAAQKTGFPKVSRRPGIKVEPSGKAVFNGLTPLSTEAGEVVKRLRERAYERRIRREDMSWAFNKVSDTAPGGFTVSEKLVDPLLNEAASLIERMAGEKAEAGASGAKPGCGRGEDGATPSPAPPSLSTEAGEVVKALRAMDTPGPNCPVFNDGTPVVRKAASLIEGMAGEIETWAGQVNKELDCNEHLRTRLAASRQEIERLQNEVQFLRDDNEAFCGHACPRQEIERLRGALQEILKVSDVDVATMPEATLIFALRTIARAALKEAR